MRRWKKVFLFLLAGVAILVFVAVHSRIGKMIAGFALKPRIEARLESDLDATVAIGGLDYRLWLAEASLVGVEIESKNRSWRASISEARLRFTLLGNVRLRATGANVLIRAKDVDVPALPQMVTRLAVSDGTLKALTADGLIPRALDVELELARTGEGHSGTATGTSASGPDSPFEKHLQWNSSGIHVE